MSQDGSLKPSLYPSQEGDIEVIADPLNDTVWMSERNVARLYGVSRHDILNAITGLVVGYELTEATAIRDFPLNTSEGIRNYRHLSFEAIISVGLYLSSKVTIRFRSWANNLLRSYIKDGYILDERRLAKNPEELRQLAAKVRALRNTEITHFEAVRQVFALTSTDYDKDSPLARKFFTLLQDKFHHAATNKTAAQIKLERADSRKPSMGLVSMRGAYPKRIDVGIGKNYLVGDELYVLNIISEQFLLFAESKAFRGQPLTMAEMSNRFDQLLALQGYAVFTGYGELLAKRADGHVAREYDAWLERTREIPAERLREF